MKNRKFLSIIFATLLMGSMSFFVSCEGAQGEPGADGNAVCLTCHNATTQALIADQYAESGHSAGLYVGYAGGRQGCARCHSHEGYVECIHTGMDTTATEDGVPLPTAIGCGTCHDFHESLDFENDGDDYALRSSGPITLLMYGHTQTLDMGNNGNVCAYCHQPRRAYDYEAGAGDFQITSTHWGPHHGPHATILNGIGGYEIPGSMAYPAAGSATHFKDASCITCHMHDGGHSWHPELTTCVDCHEGAADFNVGGLQTKIAGLITDLENALVAAGVMEITEGEAHVIPGTYTAVQAGAFFNYATMVDDRSDGVHNPAYIEALLVNSIEAL
jgi:hypothetical protein